MSDTYFSKGCPNLSFQALSIWAKSVYLDPCDDHYLQLWQHLEDAGEVASRVWDEFVADDIRRLIGKDVGSEQAAGLLYRFIAAIHDIGKASPAFVVQVPRLADKVRQTGLRIHPDVSDSPDRSQYRHELVGCWTIESWMSSKGFRTGNGTLAHGIAGIVAGHHGTSLTDGKQELLHRWDCERFTGDETWQDVRFEMLDWIADVMGVEPILLELHERPLRRRTQILLTALVIIADWIASDSRLCPLNESSSDDRDEHCFDPQRRAARAWNMLGLPKPWNPVQVSRTPDALFAEQFDIPGARLRPVQREAIRMAQTMDKPSLMIVEANMGEGKTEAALLSAEILASRFHCGGIYYALPTQATVNAMFGRVLNWIGHLPAADRCMVASLFLAHGKRELNDEYETLRERWFDDGHGLNLSLRTRSSVGFVDGDTDGIGSSMSLQAVVNSWLTGRKRGNLSDFVVGTIDQVLMAGLRCRHVVLRHMALAGKVVILDEIHSNTAYMNVYMETVLAWLGAYGVPVIMLSATLPQSRRKAFLDAYRQGARAADTAERVEERYQTSESYGSVRPQGRKRLLDRKTQYSRSAMTAASASAGGIAGPAARMADAVLDTASEQPDLRYPLISVSNAGGLVDVSPEPSGRATNVRVSMIADDDDTLISTLKNYLRDGGCAVIIRDTVARAQHTYDLLSRHLDMDVMLAHSRFLACDRARLDRALIDRYGKHGDRNRRNGIVVATQVVEQSLDVDFDMMITDAAPIDLILQRAGRLHRHRRGMGECERPEPLRRARMIITGVEEISDHRPPRFARGLERVYQRYLLMRSLSVLRIGAQSSTSICIPDDIPHLVQTVYGDGDICSDTWREGENGEQAARIAVRDVIANSENQAGQLRIFTPMDRRRPFSLDGWLYVNLPDPDAPGCSREQLVSAGVRESDDSVEVIVLQRDEAGDLQLPSWESFSSSTSLPTGTGVPDRQQTRDILSCTIALSRSMLKGCGIDAVIEALERSVPEQWRTYMAQNRELAGQLLIVLDGDGDATYAVRNPQQKGGTMKTLHVHYSMEKGMTSDVE
ncbi:CRISPR-associated helicase Cas3' [Bifidobacterium felsineum]|uniref:CRISPR-associated helicase Cas3' n=1 Tax=Bifidobacterium felsineum TaxID=2045440 RepID=UPI001BDC54D5|nr:CRISPR-associated helicase Cas3' [Bifidobacterium felsineum]MBT1164310.1 CRISPR-associated helicase Cas3' [Bifidobacterium felsineum]